MNSSVPDAVKENILERLHAHVEENYIGRYDVRDVVAEWKKGFLYINWIEGMPEDELEELTKELPDKAKELHRQLLKNDRKHPDKLCRLKYTGDTDNLELQIYKYSDSCYDTHNEFPYHTGTVEECFDAAASLYITRTFP